MVWSFQRAVPLDRRVRSLLCAGRAPAAPGGAYIAKHQRGDAGETWLQFPCKPADPAFYGAIRGHATASRVTERGTLDRRLPPGREREAETGADRFEKT